MIILVFDDMLTFSENKKLYIPKLEFFFANCHFEPIKYNPYLKLLISNADGELYHSRGAILSPIRKVDP
jgi:hypothetical protein